MSLIAEVKYIFFKNNLYLLPSIEILPDIQSNVEDESKNYMKVSTLTQIPPAGVVLSTFVIMSVSVCLSFRWLLNAYVNCTKIAILHEPRIAL